MQMGSGEEGVMEKDVVVPVVKPVESKVAESAAVSQSEADKAREQAPPCPEEAVKVGLRRLKRSYQMEIFLPAEGLNGFQPREFDRLGLNYVVHDVELGSQSWSVDRTPPVDGDPSRWGSAQLDSR